MITWIIYDISADRARDRVAKLCQRAGLYRVQESVFLGELEGNRLDELRLQFSALIDEETDRVYLAPICSEDFERIEVVGLGFDRDLVSARCRQVFF